MVSVQRLPNGVTVILDRRPQAKTASMVIGFRGGSSEERCPGATHFLEHLVTMRDPWSASITQDLDAIGMEMNAHISNDAMLFYCTVPGRHAAWAFDLLASLVLDPGFTREDVERERNVVFEEFLDDLDDAHTRLEELKIRQLFNGHALANPVLGHAVSLRRLTYRYLRRHWQLLLDPHRIVVTIVGRFNRAKLSRMIRERFQELQRPPDPLPFRSLTPPHRSREHCIFRSEDLKQVMFQWTILLGGYASKYRHALLLLGNILGGRYSSPLFLTLRNQGKIYQLDADIWFYPEVGLLTLTSATAKAHLHETLRVIHQTFAQYRTQGISAGEYEIAMRSLRSRTRLRFAETEYAAKFYTGQMVAHRHVISDRDFLRSLGRTSRRQLNDVAYRFLRPQHWRFAAIGPLTQRDKEKIRALLART